MKSPFFPNWVRTLTRLTVLLLVASCTGRVSGGGGKTPAPPGAQAPGPAVAFPFEPFPPSVYGSKVKNLLTGQALTDAELKVLTADPSKLRSLVDGWMAQPEWEQRMLVFFEQAFQQTQVSQRDFEIQFDPASEPGFGPNTRMNIVRQFVEMLPRTALELMREGRPFTEVVTTTRFMLTPPLMSILADIDANPRRDDLEYNYASDYVRATFPNLSVTEVDGGVPFSESIDPKSPNFMVWSAPAGPDDVPSCAYPRIFSDSGEAMFDLPTLVFGIRRGCGQYASNFPDSDWDAWRMVNIRQPRTPAEPKTLFWDVPTLRTTQELVLQLPRVGFMTTPAFFANWPTNSSNVARVTANQTMIVALGFAFDDRGVNAALQSSANDQEHAKPGSPCYSCHQTLDPMRDFFRQTYTYGYGPRDQNIDDAGVPGLATFSALGSPPVSGHGIQDLASAIVRHPRFPVAWVQKLCRFANSADCSEDDPEFQRVVQGFVQSNYNFKQMMAELFASPLVTFATETKTADDRGAVVSIARHDTLCSSLSSRLQLPDLCGLYGAASDGLVSNLFHSIPGDGYARGAEAPILPTQPDLFFQSATEAACARLAVQLVDGSTADGGSSRFLSAQKEAAFRDMVTTLMGVPEGDKRAPALRTILRGHFEESLAAGVSPTGALQSTFMLACASPSSVASGL